MHRQSTLDLHVYTVLLTCSLAHCSCSWPSELDQAVLVAKQRTHALVILVVAHCKCNIKAVSII